MAAGTLEADRRTSADEQDRAPGRRTGGRQPDPAKRRTLQSFKDEMNLFGQGTLFLAASALGVWLGVEVLLVRHQATGIEAPSVVVALLLFAQPIVSLIRIGEHKRPVAKKVPPVISGLLLVIALWLALADVAGSAPDRLTFVAFASSAALFLLGWWLITDRA